MSTAHTTNSPDLATFGGGTILGAAASIRKGDEVFQRFLLRHVLGVGGMGVVWLAHDKNLEQDVALKFVPDALRHDPDAIQDLKNQTKLGLKLTHDNIVKVLGFESDDHLAAIVMEYVDGPTLAAMRVDQAAQVFEADSFHVYLLNILKALEYAHDQARIVHRDLKPANVMVTSEDKIKIADFGIACSLRNSVGRVMSMPQRSGSGTLHYMSPQQLLGGEGCVADDIYSLGATVFELLAGSPPFQSGDVATQIQKIPAPSITSRRRQNCIEGEPVPEAWEIVIAAALEKEPSLRPSNAEEFRKGLLGQPFKRGTGSGGPSPVAIPSYIAPITQPTPLPQIKSSRTLVIGSVAAVAIVGAATFWKPNENTSTKLGETDNHKIELAAKIKDWSSHQARAEAAESDTSPASDKLQRWNDLLAEIRETEFVSDSTVRKIMTRAELRSDHWKEEVRKNQSNYLLSVNDLKRANEEAVKLSEQKEKGASVKAAKWNEVVKRFIPVFEQADEKATEHVTLLNDAKREAARWQAEAEQEAPKSLPPEDLVFLGGNAAGWAAHGKKEMLKIVQSALAFKGCPGVTSTGKWDLATFNGLVSWQKEKGLPATGVLDARSIEALGLQGMPEPKLVAAAPKPTTGTGTTRTTRTTSPAPSESNPWAKAVQDRIGRGGALPGPPMPFGAN